MASEVQGEEYLNWFALYVNQPGFRVNQDNLRCQLSLFRRKIGNYFLGKFIINHDENEKRNQEVCSSLLYPVVNNFFLCIFVPRLKKLPKKMTAALEQLTHGCCID